MRHLLQTAVALTWMSTVPAGAQPLSATVSAPAAIELAGTVTRADKGTYQDHVFIVPPGIVRIDVTFTHTHRGEGTEIEVGLSDPQRFRGTSRFSKSEFHVAEHHASPSYMAGPLPPGPWRVSLAVPAVGAETVATWRAVVTMEPAGRTTGFRTALREEAGWYAGDLHAHTMHSDGFGCAAPGGTRRGCSAADVVQAARARGLQFLAVTDHNTTSHHSDLAGLQAAHDDLLLLRGQEVTTFRGHANVYGTSVPVNFRLGHQARTVRDIVADVSAAGALLSINHPGRETGDRCTGCGWDAPDTPWAEVPAIEVVNGTNVEGPTAGLPFWYARLDAGHRMTAIGGSDDHGASQGRAQIGSPTTVVWAARLDEAGVLDGLRSGRVHIRTRGPDGPFLDMHGRVDATSVAMGGTLRVRGPAATTFDVQTREATGQSLHLVCRGDVVATRIVRDTDTSIDHVVQPGDWCHALLRDADGITAIGNPIYVR